MTEKKESFLTRIIDSIFMDRRVVEGAKFLGGTPIFKELDRRRLGKLYLSLVERKYGAGEEIFAEGDIGKALFIVREGEVAIVKVQPDGGQLLLVKLRAGAYFGELALLDELPRSAGARTTEPSTMLILYKANFDGLIEKDPSIGVPVITHIARTISGQIRKMNEQMADLLAEQKKLRMELDETVLPQQKPAAVFRKAENE